MATPRIGKFPTTTVTWSDGTLFNGFALISYVPATGGAGTYTETDFGRTSPAEQLPQFAMVPIIDGLYNTALGLYFNAEISPPGSTYIARIYDTTKRVIGGPTAPFTVTTDPINSIPSMTLTVPSSGGTAPTPN